jgi:hypothetical protein
MTIALSADDYAIIRYNRKPKLCFVLNPKKAVIAETLETDEPEHIKFAPEDVLANLGPKPYVGKVHGVHVEPMRRQAQKPYGLLCFYKKLEKKDVKNIKSAFNWMWSTLEELDIRNVLPVTRIEIREKKSRYAGMYAIKRTKGGDVTDRIELYCQDYQDRDYLQYVVAHETGHALWYKLIPEQLRSRWLELYESRISVSKFSEKQLTTLLNDVMEYEGGIQAYSREVADDDTRALIREIYSYFKRTYKLDRRDVELLMETSRKLGSMWPTAAALGRTVGIDLGEYAMTKPTEFFAECFAFHMVGKKLPKDCRKLMEETLKKSSYAE